MKGIWNEQIRLASHPDDAFGTSGRHPCNVLLGVEAFHDAEHGVLLVKMSVRMTAMRRSLPTLSWVGDTLERTPSGGQETAIRRVIALIETTRSDAARLLKNELPRVACLASDADRPRNFDSGESLCLKAAMAARAEPEGGFVLPEGWQQLDAGRGEGPVVHCPVCARAVLARVGDAAKGGAS